MSVTKSLVEAENRCALCQQDAVLRQSHIVPKFASDWIKETSVTGYMRNYRTPNKREQDGIKKKLLCHDCEQRLSEFEKWFSEEIFKPYLNGEVKSVAYDIRLRRFVASLAFRTAHLFGCVTDGKPHFDKALNRAVEEWRRFLLGEIQIDSYEHHVIPLDYDFHPSGQVPEKLADYFMRSIAYDIVRNEKENYLAVYTKLPGFAFISMVSPKKIVILVAREFSKVA